MKYQYLYYSNIHKRWMLTEKFYKHEPKFKCIVKHLQKFIPPEGE